MCAHNFLECICQHSRQSICIILCRSTTEIHSANQVIYLNSSSTTLACSRGTTQILTCLSLQLVDLVGPVGISGVASLMNHLCKRTWVSVVLDVIDCRRVSGVVHQELCACHQSRLWV